MSNGEAEAFDVVEDVEEEVEEQAPPEPAFAFYVGGPTLAFTWAGLTEQGDVVLVWDFEAEGRRDLEPTSAGALNKGDLLRACAILARRGVPMVVDETANKDTLISEVNAGLDELAVQLAEAE